MFILGDYNDRAQWGMQIVLKFLWPDKNEKKKQSFSRKKCKHLKNGLHRYNQAIIYNTFTELNSSIFFAKARYVLRYYISLLCVGSCFDYFSSLRKPIG